jgi:hypothetical protein
MALWPIPSIDDYMVRAYFNTPEDDLDVDSDANTDIKVPNNVVVLGALYKALNERGEEIGEPGGIAETNYYNALSRAISLDMNNRSRADGYVWFRD